MNQKNPHSLTYDWGRVAPFSTGIRSRELTARVQWFITMRWLAVFACGVATLGAVLGLLPARLAPLYFEMATVLLATTNVLYTFVARTLLTAETRHRRAQRFLVVQMIGDFTALAIITYACGSVETPIVTLFLAHIILATLFFSRNLSFAIIGAAWIFASAPLVLEWAGLIPVLAIFNSNFKQVVTGNRLITGGFVAGIGGVFFACWYLVGVISRSLKLRERELEQAHEMLTTMDREKTQATLRATHELKAPFAAIKSYVYTLRDGYCGALPEKAQHVVARIGERCDQLTRKISYIIHLSNLKTLMVTEMDLGPVDLVELITEESREGALIGEPRDVAVEYLTSETVFPPVMGSKPHLRTLLSNLIRNAVHYSHNGGRVEISLEKSGNHITVCIADQGIGIPKENLDKIFTEHFRSNIAVNHYAGGSGLGLSIVKEIARLHGAVIHVNSDVGTGSRFFIRFDLFGAKKRRGSHG